MLADVTSKAAVPCGRTIAEGFLRIPFSLAPHSAIRVEKNGNGLNFSFSEQESEKMLYDLPY